ncbi:MAG: hypothetical protein DWQ05_07705 [Calditrichaeota bacterium]|nr:MAG: hypothetical protein DWQ05_07705 [Calditrichota bacterium]
MFNFSTDIVDFLNNLSAREKILAGITGLGLFLFLLFHFVYLPLFDRWEVSNQQLVNLQHQYAKALRTSNNASLNKQNTAQSPQNAQAASSPIAQFLKDIENAAGNHVLINRFQPYSPARAQNRQQTRKNKSDIITLQVEIDCIGELPALIAFIHKIEQSDNYTRVRNSYFAPAKQRNEKLKCQITVTRLFSV